MTTPTGTVKTPPPEGGSFGVQWQAVTQFDDSIHAAADQVGWPAERIRAHILIESRGNPRAVQNNLQNGPSYGLMQVVAYGVGWGGWHDLVIQKAGLNKNASRTDVINSLYEPRTNIAVGVAILESFYQQYGTLDRASSAFFTGTPDWSGPGDSVNGTTPAAYKRSLDGLIAEQKSFAPVDPIAVIVGGPYPPITYGWLADAGLPYYSYGVGHGTTSATQHTGADVPVPIGTDLFAPFSGRILCRGGEGQNVWGQGCGAYTDTDYGAPGSQVVGIGNITLLGDNGYKLTLGHCKHADLRPGDRVAAGQHLGTSGGQNGPHVHVEMAVQRNGTYWLLEPVAALRDAMSGQAPITYADRLPLPQPADFTNSWRVVATRDGVPVLQSTAANAPKVGPDLKQGEDFQAVGLLIGQDGKPWWISSRSARVPLDGTEGPLVLRGAS